MYQKSPFPYLFLFVFIIASASFSNITMNKKIEAPIVYKIDFNPIHTNLKFTKNYKSINDSIQVASIR